MRFRLHLLQMHAPHCCVFSNALCQCFVLPAHMYASLKCTTAVTGTQWCVEVQLQPNVPHRHCLAALHPTWPGVTCLTQRVLVHGVKTL